jgi:hypothetical protein
MVIVNLIAQEVVLADVKDVVQHVLVDAKDVVGVGPAVQVVVLHVQAGVLEDAVVVVVVITNVEDVLARAEIHVLVHVVKGVKTRAVDALIHARLIVLVNAKVAALADALVDVAAVQADVPDAGDAEVVVRPDAIHVVVVVLLDAAETVAGLVVVHVEMDALVNARDVVEIVGVHVGLAAVLALEAAIVDVRPDVLMDVMGVLVDVKDAVVDAVVVAVVPVAEIAVGAA